MKLFLLVICFCMIIPTACAFGKTKENSLSTENGIVEMQQQTDEKYSFDENILRGKVVKLKKGTTLPIILKTPLDTSKAQEDDTVEAILGEDLEYEGMKIAEQGSILYGKIIKAKSAAKCMRNGKITVNFDKIITTDNKTYNISTKNIKFVVANEDKWLYIGKSFLEIVGVAAYLFITAGTGVIVIAAYMMQAPETGFSIFDKRGDDAVIPATTLLETSLDSTLKATVSY